MSRTPEEIRAAFAVPFGDADVKWKPATVRGNRALALCYVDSRAVMDRLDEVVGVDGWKDDYESLADGNVRCKLSVLIEGSWITKMDVGGESEQPDDGDKCKAAHSDALKRAAVKFGIGRHLYRLPQQWVDYDPQARRFVQTPKLPAPPKQAVKPQAQPQPQKPAEPDADGECITPAQADDLRKFFDPVWIKEVDFCRAWDLPELADLECRHLAAAYSSLTILRAIRTSAEKGGVTLGKILAAFPEAAEARSLFDLDGEQLQTAIRRLNATLKQKESVTA